MWVIATQGERYYVSRINPAEPEDFYLNEQMENAKSFETETEAQCAVSFLLPPTPHLWIKEFVILRIKEIRGERQRVSDETG